MTRLAVTRAADERPLWTAEVATSWLARLQGLIGRPALARGQGLYLPGTNSIHMLFMAFAIDCVFVGPSAADGTRRVVALRAGLRPWTGVVWWARGAQGALELPAGSIAEAGLAVGESIRFSAVG
jgi:hypothetical protein